MKTNIREQFIMKFSEQLAAKLSDRKFLNNVFENILLGGFPLLADPVAVLHVKATFESAEFIERTCSQRFFLKVTMNLIGFGKNHLNW